MANRWSSRGQLLSGFCMKQSIHLQIQRYGNCFLKVSLTNDEYLGYATLGSEQALAPALRSSLAVPWDYIRSR